MNALAQHVGPIAHSVAVPLLRTLLLCDLVDSTALVQRLGDQRAAELFRKHDRITRALLSTHGGREIDKTDGFLLMFDRPVQAVAFAIDYVRSLRDLNVAESSTMSARVGIHVGDLVAWDNSAEDIAKGAKPIEVEGLVKPITSRLMQLALPNQILLSGVAYEIAHRAQGELGARLENLRWRTHGRYRFKGVPDPITVFEAGEQGFAPLKAPPWSGKAHRETPFWRRPATLGIEMFLVMLAIAIPAWYLFRPAPAIAFAQRDWVVVGDLKNLTGDARFDESIETAFRIGLEQSRYVNVLSNLKTRETVQLMQRDPEKTPVDRAIGTEVALRDGARALILPTIAEVGGRVRVTAEVIDPNTQTTVYSESADGVGAESVLPSLDQVNQKLRVRLGEALATVSKESQPLDKVATSDLDALRAYSLAEKGYRDGNIASSVALYQQALKVDPKFALANVGLARSLVVSDDKNRAVEQLEMAKSNQSRLSPKESLLVDAWLASLRGPHNTALEKWNLLSELYPDSFPAHGLKAYFTWQFSNRHGDDVVESAKKAASPRNPYASASLVLLGTLHVANERFGEARKQFEEARKSGMEWNIDYTLADAAERRFDQAEKTLASAKASGVAARDVDSVYRGILLAADKGAWSDVWKRLDDGKRSTLGVSEGTPSRFALIDAALRLSVQPERVEPAQLRDVFRPTIDRLATDIGAYRVEAQEDALFAAYLAARRSNAELSREIMAKARPHDDGDSVLSAMYKLADAQSLLAEDKPQDAINLLTPMLNGSELFITHVTLLQAYKATGNFKAALDEARWLASHRGRAYAEYDANRVPFNVIQSDLALLDAAECAIALGDTAGAKRSLDDFRKVWPEAEQPSSVMVRIKKL